jgi:uncharacterized protein with GYD domain
MDGVMMVVLLTELTLVDMVAVVEVPEELVLLMFMGKVDQV